jgi:hypothetical protein
VLAAVAAVGSRQVSSRVVKLIRLGNR